MACKVLLTTGAIGATWLEACNRSAELQMVSFVPPKPLSYHAPHSVLPGSPPHVWQRMRLPQPVVRTGVHYAGRSRCSCLFAPLGCWRRPDGPDPRPSWTAPSASSSGRPPACRSDNRSGSWGAPSSARIRPAWRPGSRLHCSPVEWKTMLCLTVRFTSTIYVHVSTLVARILFWGCILACESVKTSKVLSSAARIFHFAKQTSNKLWRPRDPGMQQP